MATIRQTTAPTLWQRIKYSFQRSTWITASWDWFMMLAGKAAEPILIISVLYTSAKVFPNISFPSQLDFVVFLAQFVALDVGGIALSKMAKQAETDRNEKGAREARLLAKWLLGVMLAGIISVILEQSISAFPGTLKTIIDTCLLIVRAVMAVMYSKVIHSLKHEHEENETNTFEAMQAEMRLSHETEIANLTAQVKREKEELETRLNQTFQSQVIQVRQGYETEINQLRLSRETAINQVRQDHETELARVRRECQREIRFASLPQTNISEERQLAPGSEQGRRSTSTRLLAAPARPATPQNTQEAPTEAPETGQEAASSKDTIYALLDKDTSLKAAAIMEKTGISRATVHRHVANWKKEHGIIETSE